MLSIAELSPGARVLDLGAGHGLSSEVLAFASCSVDAVDIDPALSELARMRAGHRGLAITRHTANFDDLSAVPDGFDAAFFFQSLHHCLRPWELIARLQGKLKRGGIIAFTGEPIQTTWWKHWGLRLDHESLYVARAYGWFESGWSLQFITECFRRNGMQLTLFTGGHGGGQIGIATATEPTRYIQRANALGHAVHKPGTGNQIERFATAVGERCELRGLKRLPEPERWLAQFRALHRTRARHLRGVPADRWLGYRPIRCHRTRRRDQPPRADHRDDNGHPCNHRPHPRRPPSHWRRSACAREGRVGLLPAAVQSIGLTRLLPADPAPCRRQPA